MNLVRPYKTLLPLALLASLSLHAQEPQSVYTPLGDTLTKALEISSLTAPGSPPFHIKLHIHDASDVTSTLQADIEEFWESPTLWKRTVTATGLHQVITVNDTGTYYENTGDYFPLWLRGFVTALVDPVPNPDLWNTPDAKLRWVVSSSAAKPTHPCVDKKLRIGADSPTINSNLCFSNDGLIASISTPGYAMQFQEFGQFHKKLIANLYFSQLVPDQYLVGKLEKIEGSNKKSDFFATPPGATQIDSFASMPLSTSVLDRLVPTPLHLDWPVVHRGKPEGTLTVFVSLDRTGQVRETSVVAADNHELDEPVRAYIDQKQWKAASSKGAPIQVEGTMTIPFSTTVVSAAASDSTGTSVVTPYGVLAGHKISGANPIYPQAAKEQHISGIVYMHAVIGRDGTITKLGLIESPSPILANAALEAVRTWKYQPYLLDGNPTPVDTTITVTFNFGR